MTPPPSEASSFRSVDVCFIALRLVGVCREPACHNDWSALLREMPSRGSFVDCTCHVHEKWRLRGGKPVFFTVPFVRVHFLEICRLSRVTFLACVRVLGRAGPPKLVIKTLACVASVAREWRRLDAKGTCCPRKQCVVVT